MLLLQFVVKHGLFLDSSLVLCYNPHGIHPQMPVIASDNEMITGVQEGCMAGTLQRIGAAI